MRDVLSGRYAWAFLPGAKFLDAKKLTKRAALICELSNANRSQNQADMG